METGTSGAAEVDLFLQQLPFLWLERPDLFVFRYR